MHFFKTLFEYQEQPYMNQKCAFHIAQNITKRCQECFLYFIAVEILSQHFCQILHNFSSQN